MPTNVTRRWLQSPLKAGDKAVHSLENTATTALAKWNKLLTYLAEIKTNYLAYPAWLVIDQINEELWELGTSHCWWTNCRHLSKALSARFAHTPDTVFTEEIELRQLYTPKPDTWHMGTNKYVHVAFLLPNDDCANDIKNV